MQKPWQQESQLWDERGGTPAPPNCISIAFFPFFLPVMPNLAVAQILITVNNHNASNQIMGKLIAAYV